MPRSLTQRLEQGPLLSDGAIGTELFAHGVPGSRVHLATLEHADAVRAIHLEYLRAGSELIQTNTFLANPLKLAALGAGERVEELNRAGVALAQESRRLTGQDVWIGGSIGPLGREAFSVGALDAAAAHNAFAQQAAVLADAGVDVFVLETFTSLAEARLAVAAVRSVSSLPLVCQLTFTEEGMSAAGDTPEEAAAALAALDVDVLGANCSVGPDLVRRVVERMGAVTGTPLSAQPNAGMPTYIDGALRYVTGPEYFAESARAMAEAGAVLLGGCCGTTPAHIAAVRDALRGVHARRARASRPAAPRREPEPVSPAPAAPPRPAERTGIAERMAQGEFLVTAELSPPRGFDISATLEALRPALGHLHAVNVADSPRAQGRMSALATCSLLQSRLGIETIMHLAIRHRNLLALHSDLLGAHALGVRNVFTVMGDVPLSGDYPQATSLADVTASGLIKLMAGFNRGVDVNGRAIDEPTSFFVGAALNLNAPDLDRELRVLERKVDAGAHFLLTQPVYDPAALERVAERLGGFPLPVLLGVLPLRSLRHARFLHHEVPGIRVPDEAFARLEAAGGDAAAEGIRISQELLRAVRSRIAGAYFMPPFGRYHVIGETLEGLDLS
ncbi:MAG: bifunctional homocysteine S-methyltransferase/methylenetetrahydrofolate reductase [Chloroflexota bacterium]